MGPNQINPCQNRFQAHKLQQNQGLQRSQQPNMQQNPVQFGAQNNSSLKTSHGNTEDNQNLIQLLANLLLQKPQQTSAAAMLNPQQAGQGGLNIMG